MTEQEAQEAAEAQAAARAEAEKRWPKPSAGDDLRKFDHQGGFVTGFVEGAMWERSRHSPEWSCPVEGCTLKPLHTHAEFEPNEWSRLVAEERAHQVEVGYDAKHDREHGLDHLLGWAEDYLRRDRRVEAGALIRAARELAPRVVVAAPSDTDRKPDPDEAVRIARAATAHNFGETVYEASDASGILRLRMSSWPRAKEAVKGLSDAGYRVAQDGNEVLVLAAPAASRTSQPVQAKPLWETKPDGRIGPTEHGLKVWNESQPVQVEVTDEMVERATKVLHGAEYPGGYGPTENDWEWSMFQRRARAALTAALGGGDHAAE